MSEAALDTLAELARLLPTVLDESALHELAARLLAIQATIALAVLTVASSIRLAVLLAGAAGAVLLIRRCGTRSLAAPVVTTVAVVSVLTIPPGTVHREDAGTGRRVTSPRPCDRPQREACRHG